MERCERGNYSGTNSGRFVAINNINLDTNIYVHMNIGHYKTKSMMHWRHKDIVEKRPNVYEKEGGGEN